MLNFKDDNTNLTIQRELTAVLYKNYPINFLATLTIATLLFWHLQDAIDQQYLNYWYIAFITVSVFRLSLWAWFTRTHNNITYLRPHYYFFLLGSSLVAILWAILGSVLMPTDLGSQSFILIAISGTFAGAVQSLGADYKVCISYVLTTLLPILFWELLQIINGSQLYIGIFMLMSLYTCYTIVIGYRYYAILVNNIKLKLKNTELFLDLKKYTSQIEFFSELETILATCNTEEEVCSVTVQFITRLLPNTTGGIYLTPDGPDKLKAAKTWGNIIKLPQTFPEGHCHAMVYNHIHVSDGEDHCPHYPKNVVFHMCIPLRTPEKVLGILTVARLHQNEISLHNQSVLVRIANDVTSSLTRLELRDALKNQAMQDFLTGLYNKRYLDEYLKMEISRVKKKKAKLGILMLDIDHFKSFNDQYGHETGDDILQELGGFIKRNTREYDTACRYGGEEFIIIMSGTALETAYQRAELLREGVKSLSVTNNNKVINNITLSIGVAVYPDHGSTVESVLEAADQALYQAKHRGRDQVCIAPSSPTPPSFKSE